MRAMNGEREIADYLRRAIPLTVSMGLEVRQVRSDAVVISMPLEGNTNHQQTMFGGSIAALGMLSGWALLYHRTRTVSPAPVLVIKTSTVDFRTPATGPCEAAVTGFDEHSFSVFLRGLQNTKRARIALVSEIVCGGRVAAVHKGEYAALMREAPRDG